MSRSRQISRVAKRWLYLAHRWTGILLCILFAIWFVSGVVMMYVPFPSFRAPERIAAAPPLDWGQVKIAPSAALESLHLADFPQEMRLEMAGGHPVYRFVTDKGRRAIAADTGAQIRNVDPAQARIIATTFAGSPVSTITLVDHDQWVVTRAYAKIAPFWRMRMADDAGTDLYISRTTGEIVQNTTAHERFWNWLGAVPHWIYFTALRVYQEPWRQTVLWTSGIGVLGAIAGIWIGILRVRLTTRYKSGSISPYRSWMKWHHVTGLIGGLFILTWAFSGWLSMSPWGGFKDVGGPAIAERYAGARPDFPATDIAAAAQSAAGAREVRFDYVGGRPILVAEKGQGVAALLDGHTGLPLTQTTGTIAAVAKAAVLNGGLISIQRIEHYDRYWYSTGDPRSDARPLPVLRLIFDDPSSTWLHIAPQTGELLARSGSGSRTYRWLFSALHSFDVPLLLSWRPLRDGLMWLFSAFGLAVSITGIVIGWKYLRPARRA